MARKKDAFRRECDTGHTGINFAPTVEPELLSQTNQSINQSINILPNWIVVDPRPAPVRYLKSLETLEWNPTGAGDKLEEPGPHLLRVALHDPPEPDHLVHIRCTSICTLHVFFENLFLTESF